MRLCYDWKVQDLGVQSSLLWLKLYKAMASHAHVPSHCGNSVCSQKFYPLPTFSRDASSGLKIHVQSHNPRQANFGPHSVISHSKSVAQGMTLSQRKMRSVHVNVAASQPALQARDFGGIEALLFDCDGVLVDTEAEGHRVAFNKAFKEKGEPHISWTTCYALLFPSMYSGILLHNFFHLCMQWCITRRFE